MRNDSPAAATFLKAEGCLQKDTLQRRAPDVVSRDGGGVEAHGAGELAHQLVLEVLSAFILLPSVDKHLVLQPQEMYRC